jgi:hypothetical protein
MWAWIIPASCHRAVRHSIDYHHLFGQQSNNHEARYMVHTLPQSRQPQAAAQSASSHHRIRKRDEARLVVASAPRSQWLEVTVFPAEFAAALTVTAVTAQHIMHNARKHRDRDVHRVHVVTPFRSKKLAYMVVVMSHHMRTIECR